MAFGIIIPQFNTKLNRTTKGQKGLIPIGSEEGAIDENPLAPLAIRIPVGDGTSEEPQMLWSIALPAGVSSSTMFLAAAGCCCCCCCVACTGDSNRGKVVECHDLVTLGDERKGDRKGSLSWCHSMANQKLKEEH